MTADSSDCPKGTPSHVWKIVRAKPPLPTSKGTCDNCGETRNFNNSMYGDIAATGQIDLSNGKKEQHKRRPAGSGRKVGRKSNAERAAREAAFEAKEV